MATFNVSVLLPSKGDRLLILLGRFPLAFQCIPGLILVAGCLFLPESPRWLCEKDRNDEARLILDRLRKGKPEELIELEHREIVDVIAADRANLEIDWKTIITKPSWRRRLLLGCGVQFFCQLSGINGRHTRTIATRSANTKNSH